MDDTYLTIAEHSEGIYKEKGSKFLSFAYHVEVEDEIKSIIYRLKKEHFSARHHCYAWRIGSSSQELFRVNDDGEPSGTAGWPIFNQIQSRELTNILVVVIRYFGGTLLGVSGLINAYKQATIDSLYHAQIVTSIIKDELTIQFAYEAMNEVMHLIKEYQFDIRNMQYDLKNSITIAVRKSLTSVALQKLQGMDGIIAISQTQMKLTQLT